MSDDQFGHHPWTECDAVVFAGDSITAAGRSTAHPFGCGFVAQMVQAFDRGQPGHGTAFHNVGEPGDGVVELAARWSRDVLALQPGWVVLLIGINDVHREVLAGTAPVHDEFERTCGELFNATLARDARIVLLDPFLVGVAELADEPYATMHRRLPSYLAATARLASRTGVTHVRLHELFQSRVSIQPAYRLAPDPVHPGAEGHRFIASAVLEATAHRHG